jgi:hypothetical protein
MTTKSNDPLNINDRLYKQLGILLDQLEQKDDDDDGPRVTLKERIAALIAVGRIQTIFAGLRKLASKQDDPDAGSSVRKYQGAFQNDPGGRKKGGRRKPPGRQPEPEPDDWFEHAAIDDDADDELAN